MREKRQWPKYMEHTRITRRDKLSSATCDSMEEEVNRHLQETERLKSILQEKDRQVEALRVKTEIARRETLEKNEQCIQDMGEHQKNLLEQSVKMFDTVLQETDADFRQAKEIITCEAREAKIMAERAFNDACEGFKEKLHDYYKQITKQDLDTVKKLKREIKKVEEGIENSKFLMQEALKENKALKECAGANLPKKGSKTVAKFDAGPLKMIEAVKAHNKIEQLALANQNLEEQIKNVMDKTFNLRRQFTLGLKKVRDSAERKVEILHRKLAYILDEKKKKSLEEEQQLKGSEILRHSPSESETITHFSESS